MRDEPIRHAKWIILPRKSTLNHVKWQLRELFPWVKDYSDDEIRLWKLHADINDQDFID